MQIVKEIKTPKAATNTKPLAAPYKSCHPILIAARLSICQIRPPSNVRVIIFLQAYKLAETYKVPQLKSFLLNAFIEIQVFITCTWRMNLYK